MDIMRHKDAVDDIVKTGKSLMNTKSPEEKDILKVGYIFNIIKMIKIIIHLTFMNAFGN